MAYKIRVILNAKEDVIRDIAIDESETLEDLHNAITNAFGFDGHEMASFYRADKEWNQGEEFPLFDMEDEFSDILTMSELPIDSILTKPSEKLIYVYDFFNMWSFYVELIDTDFHSTNLELPSLVFSLGAVPKTAPDVKFENDKKSGPKVEEDFDEFDDDDEDDEDLDEFYEEDYDSF